MDKNKKIGLIKKAVSSIDAKKIGDKLWIKKDNISPQQFKMGLNVEREHWSLVSDDTNETKDDPIRTWKIAWVHLKELKDYYTRLEKMEKEGNKKK